MIDAISLTLRGLPLSRAQAVAYAPAMDPAPEDSALMLRYKDGDVAAFETLYRRHNDALYRYLLRLCRHRDTIRRNQRHQNTADIEPDTQTNPGDEPDIETERSLARRRLDLALQDLPEEQRDVFLLHEESGLSIDQIAHVTGVNRETIKSRLRYAVKKLRAAISEPTETS